MKIKYNDLSLRNLHMEREIKEYFENKNAIYNKKYKIGKKILDRARKSNSMNSITFGDEIENIKNNILLDVGECNSKTEKDVLIIIDFNIYNSNYEDNLYTKTYKIDSFIEQTQLILNTYLSNNDRFCVLIYTDEYKMICPLMEINKIDINSFSNDLFDYRNMFLDENEEEDEFAENINELITKNNPVFNIGEDNVDEFASNDDSSKFSEQNEKNYDKINILITAINYVNTYSKMKEKGKNEKYIILFTDLINLNFKDEKQIGKNIESLMGNKDIIFLLIGKIKNKNLNKEKNNDTQNRDNLEYSILYKFSEKSEIIYFENMKKIKTILSNNTVIKDEILFPNEIYK